MHELDIKFPPPNDGCQYYTFEEYEGFGNLFSPVDFDPSSIKRKYLDIQYGTLPEQKLDLYLPSEGDGPWPLIIYVHGGGWSFGTKTLGAISCIIDALEYGYAVMSVDYRLVPHVAFPEFIFDVKTAVRWARAHSEEYGIDPNRFAMIGDSAGGHITLMVGFTENHPEYEGEEYGWAGYSSGVQAICDMYGPADLAFDHTIWFRDSQVKRFPYPGEDPGYEPMFGTKNPHLLKLISPISFVHKDIPPALIQQGMDDGIVAYQHSSTLAERIEQVCGPGHVELKLYPNRNHSDKAFLTRKNCEEVVAFFDKYLK